MKRGASPMLETIVRFTPHLLVIFVVLGVIYATFLHPLLFAPLTAQERNFVRLHENLDQILEMPPGQPVPVLLTAEESYTIEIYPADSQVLPAGCKGEACICLWQLKGDEIKKPHQTCKQYPELSKCSGFEDVCGIQPCIEEFYKIVVDKGVPSGVTISRPCNTVQIV